MKKQIKIKKNTKKKVTKALKQKSEKELTLVKAPLTLKQLMAVIQKTPAQHIYRRPAKGGGQWEYVTGVYVKKVLNYVFGWMWDFEIKEHGREDGLVWVLGRLTINDGKGNKKIVKEQFGRADIKFKRGTKEPLDFGNDLKAAATDALKKCAAELGIASDIYGKEEFKEIQQIDKGFIPPQEEITDLQTIQQIEDIQEEQPKIIKKAETTAPQLGVDPMVQELKNMLKGKTDEAKIKDLEKRTGIILRDFKITKTHASRLIAELLNKEVK